MGQFSDQVKKQLAGNYTEPANSIDFSCNNCLKNFNFNYSDIYLKKSGDIEFIPEPSCPKCGSTQDLMFTDYSQEKIEDMLMDGKIQTV